MAKRRNDAGGKGRNFYETTSPFETQTEPAGASGPKTYSGLTDSLPNPLREAPGLPGRTHIPGGELKLDPQQYDNPRGFPGLSMVTRGDQKSKLGKHDTAHSLQHDAEGGARFARTGKRD
jgi:hypothetical protein